MSALLGGTPPSLAGSFARLLWHPRPGLATLADMPHVERELKGVRVSESWLHAYLRCTGAGNWPATRLPPLALQIAAAPLHMAVMADRAFPFSPLGIVHQSQQVQQWRMLAATVSYDLKVTTSPARAERKGTSFGLVTEARQAGELVWRSEVRVLSFSAKPDKAPPPAQPEIHASHGEAAQSETFIVPESTGRDYARIASDYNPVHVHALLARLFGFRHAIAHGTWTLAQAMFLTGLPAASRYDMEARFRRPVDLPSTIRVRRFTGDAEDESRLVVSRDTDEVPLIEARIHG